MTVVSLCSHITIFQGFQSVLPAIMKAVALYTIDTLQTNTSIRTLTAPYPLFTFLVLKHDKRAHSNHQIAINQRKCFIDTLRHKPISSNVRSLT